MIYMILHTVSIMFVDVRKCMRDVVERIDKPGVFSVDFSIYFPKGFFANGAQFSLLFSLNEIFIEIFS